MNRIAQRFELLRRDGRKGFVPFVTAGDPDLATSLLIVRKLAECGADVIELGVPFSDPMADGPTIQRSSQRALENGVTLEHVIGLAKQFRTSSDVPVVLFSYFNPILSFGLDRFADAVAAAGVDGVLLTDVIEDEAAAISERFAAGGVDLISLIAPTTTDERLEKICKHARGFIYAVSRAGVTGARETTSVEAERLVRRARQFSELPVAVGFGISTRGQIEDVWRYADAAVVGSAIVAEIERAGPNAVSAVEGFVGQLLPQFAKGGAEN
jgi:tryptophan synthase alpha chain